MPPLESGSTLIAWWGAGLSTLLALVKIAELWRDRFRLEISYSFTGDETIGNEVLIRNVTDRSLILAYWELLYCSGRRPFRHFLPLQGAEHDEGDHVIPAFSSYSLRFSEENYFDWGVSALKGRAIFIRLHIAGRRPLLRKVFAH